MKSGLILEQGSSSEGRGELAHAAKEQSTTEHKGSYHWKIMAVKRKGALQGQEQRKKRRK